MLKRFLKDERGATAIEYGLICGLIFLTIVTALHALGGGTGGLYQRMGDRVNEALN